MQYITKFKDYNKYLKEYTNYHGTSDGFDEIWSKLFSTDFEDGGLKNIPEYVYLSRLVNIKDSFNSYNNIHWVRTSDENLFYDKDWLFLTNISIDDNTKIIRIKTPKSNIDMERTIIQNITFTYEKEISLKKIEIKDYEVVDY